MGNIIIISYFYKPLKMVGVLRASYWYEKLKENGVNVKLLTATQNQSDPSVITIKPLQGLFRRMSIDAGLAWSWPLKKALKNHFLLDEVDNIIITGGPFFHFILSRYIKRKHPNVNLILDYRDPFANNIRFGEQTIKNIIKNKLEGLWNRYADYIISVNEYCGKLINTTKEVLIIENGYDERFFTDFSTSVKNKDSVVYSGKIYDVDPKPFRNVIKDVSSLNFYFYGGDIGLNGIKNYHYTKFIDYSELATLLPKYSIGVIFTGGVEFESTTKIFDYMAAKLKILVVSEGKLNTGNINKILSDNPNVLWTKNNEEEIKSSITLLKEKDYIEWDYSKYSRSNGLKILESIIK